MAEQAFLWIAGALLILSGHTPATIAGVFLLGVVFARNLEFVHETLHGNALRSSLGNRLAGTLLAMPMLVSFERWRYEHARHHHDVRNEGFRYEYERLDTYPELFMHLFMVRHFADALRNISSSLFQTPAIFPHRIAVRVRGDYALLLATLAAVVAVTIVTRSAVPVLLWLAPLPVAALVHTHIELPEHLGRERDHNDAFSNSRIVLAGRFATWFVNANNYHAVHHWNARIANEQLGAACSLIAQEAPLATSTYGAFFREFYRAFGHSGARGRV
jgi:fatty acid desaturase